MKENFCHISSLSLIWKYQEKNFIKNFTRIFFTEYSLLDTSTEAEKNVFKPYTINNHFLIIIIITIIVNTDIITILITYNFFQTLFDSLMVRPGFFPTTWCHCRDSNPHRQSWTLRDFLKCALLTGQPRLWHHWTLIFPH